MVRVTALALTIFATLASPDAFAQPVETPTAAQLTLATKLLEVTNSRARMMRLEEAITPKVLEMIHGANPDIDEKTIKSFGGAFHEEIQASLGELLKQMAQVYARHFTEEDLQTILQFYETPVGKKLLKEMPILQQENMALGEAWGREAGELAEKRAIARLRKEGIRI